MGAIQYLLEDRVGTVHFDVPRYRPASAKVTVKTSGNTALPSAAVDEATATVDECTRTVASWVAAAPRIITLNSGTGSAVVGRHYLTITANGKRETVKVIGVDGEVIEIADKLPHDLAASDVFASTRISYNLTAAQLANRGLFRCKWDYVVSGLTYTVETLFRTVQALPYNPGTAAGLRDAEPQYTSQWDQMVQREGSWESALDRAWDKVLQSVEGRKVVEGDGPVIDRIVDWSQAEQTVYARVLLDMAPTRRPSEDWEVTDWVRDRQNAYRHAFDDWMNSVRWIDDDSGDRILADGESGRDLTSIRMSR